MLAKSFLLAGLLAVTSAKAPVIAPEHAARFQQADNRLYRAQMEMQAAQQEYQAAAAVLVKDCGDKFKVTQDGQTRGVSCSPK